MSKRIDQDFVTGVVVMLFCLTFFVSSFFISYERVVGASMEPTYKSGDILVATKSADEGDLTYRKVIVAKGTGHTEGLYIIKRIVALPGDVVLIRDGMLYVNGVPEEDGYEKILDPGIAASPITLKDNEYFVLGDNRNGSEDSRVFGPLDIEDIESIILFKIL